MNDQDPKREPAAIPPLADTSGSAFMRAKLYDVTVARMLKEGAGAEAIIGQLAADKEQYLKRIMELESIAPRKIVLPDGRVMAWQCPLEFVPPMNPPNTEVRRGDPDQPKT